MAFRRSTITPPVRPTGSQTVCHARVGTRRSRAGDVARPDVPTCDPDDRVGEVQARVRAAGWDQCVVVNEERVVLGRLRKKALEAAPETPVEQVMEVGPATIRPDIRLDAILDRLQQRNAGQILVTTSDGRLVGALRRELSLIHI